MAESQYRVHSPAAIAGGMAAAGGATALLVRDALETGFTIDHALMPVLVGLTILTGHLAGRAFREWRALPAIFFLFLSIFGSAIIVYETMGRRAELRDLKVAAAQAENFDRNQLLADLKRSKKRKEEAEAMADAERRADYCGRRCKDWERRADEVQSHVEKLQRQLAAAPAEVPVDAKASRVAAIAALFGVSPEATEKVVTTIEPFLLPLFLELGSIWLFGYGFSHSRRTPDDQTSASAPQAVALVSPPPAAPALLDAEVEELRNLLTQARQPLTNGELAQKLRISKAEASKRATKAVDAGIVARSRHGRGVAISLVRH